MVVSWQPSVRNAHSLYCLQCIQNIMYIVYGREYKCQNTTAQMHLNTCCLVDVVLTAHSVRNRLSPNSTECCGRH